MGVRELLHDLRMSGYRVDVSGDKLRITPATVPADLLAAVKANKPDLLALLSEVHPRWGIRIKGGRAVEVAACPPMTRAEVLANYPDAVDATPCPSLSGAEAVRSDLVHAVGEVADAEGWPDAQRAHLLALVARQPAFTLADDVAHFRQRLQALHAANRASEIAACACGTCAHREVNTAGVRCAMARAMDWRHHAWLDAPEQANDCGLYERGER